MTLLENLPTFTVGSKKKTTVKEFRAAYGTVPCVIFKKQVAASSGDGGGGGGKKRKRPRDTTRTSDDYATKSSDDDLASRFCQILLDTFETATPKDQESWCIETSNNPETLKAKDNDKNNSKPRVSSTMTASEFLAPTSTEHGYCSFVLQDNSEHAITNFTEQHAEFPVLPLACCNTDTNNDKDETTDMDDTTIFISEPYWLFVGRNTNGEPMPGRSEHTDNIAHDGTFHHQVVGSKTWKLRPTQELRERCDEDHDLALKDHYEVTVEEGDIIVLNTRIWWHQTELPASTSTKTGVLSISYARDMYLDGKQPEAGDTEFMSSLDGAWATDFIAKGTVLLTETDPPIRRSNQLSEANLEMFPLEDDNGSDDSGDDDDNSDKGRMKYELVATKDIQEGEWFVIHDETVDDDGLKKQEEIKVEDEDTGFDTAAGGEAK
jgi:hypothetical protein